MSAARHNGVLVGQRYRDLDSRQKAREGDVIAIHGRKAKIAWSTGVITTVACKSLGSASRYYALIKSPAPEPRPPVEIPTGRARTIGAPTSSRACLFDGIYRCHVCHAFCATLDTKGQRQRAPLLLPWRQILFADGRSTVVCSDACHATLDRAMTGGGRG